LSTAPECVFETGVLKSFIGLTGVPNDRLHLEKPAEDIMAVDAFWNSAMLPLDDTGVDCEKSRDVPFREAFAFTHTTPNADYSNPQVVHLANYQRSGQA